MIRRLRLKQKRVVFLYAIAVLVMLVPIGMYYNQFVPKNSIAHYYNIINTQEQVAEDTMVTDAEWEELQACKKFTGMLATKKTLDCVERFYVEYTLNNGVRKAFSHLAALEKKSTDFVADCHYVSHGIGHAQLRVDGGDAAKSFAELSENLYFKNVATCGNGYFHGVVEELAKNTTDKKKLVTLLRPLCETTRVAKSDCYHGVGHAAFIQLEYNMKDSLEVCDAISEDTFMNFSCYMGVFMEMSQDFNKSKLVDVVGDSLRLRTCEPLEYKYQEACYAQLSGFYEDIAKEPKNYKQTIQYCQQIADERNRLACIKLLVGRAVRTAQYQDIRGMCIEGTRTPKEQYTCAASFATRVARSIDSGRGSEYEAITRDICKYLPPWNANKCIELALSKGGRIYFDPPVMGVM